MRRFFLSAALLLSFTLVTPAIAQSTFGTISGTIDDGTGALIPGVTVTATSNDTAVVTTVLSNEAGVYNFASLPPGTYRLSAQLPGFQRSSVTGVQLGNRDQLRVNFKLTIASVATSVEVSVSADSLLTMSSSSVGQVLTQQKVQDMPTVGNNVLDLLRLLPGARMNEDGVNGTFAGISADKVNMTRDGVDASGSAYWVQAGAQSATFINPDLVGEIRMILAPVDAELGRGNAQIQFMTRSGTNRYTGSAVWSVQNTALDANTWGNNNDINARTGQWSPTKPNWVNSHQYTVSYGGPIIRGKTFFFVLYDGTSINARTTQNPLVLTPCARNGIFRYFENWSNGNSTLDVPTLGTTPTIKVVDGSGNPLPPATNPDGSAHNKILRYASVFGPVTNTPTRSDCSDAVVGAAPTATGTWDVNRKAVDPTGFVTKVVGKLPAPNNFEVGDGLNTAGYRWTRSENGGTEGIFGFGGNLARDQINVKIDHNFSAAHKVATSYTYERSQGPSTLEPFPDGFRGQTRRTPQTLSVAFTSTLSPTLLNEARLGYRRTSGRSFSAFNNPDNGDTPLSFYPNINGYPVIVVPLLFANVISNNTTTSYQDNTPLWTYGDSISWTKSAHAFKVGAELRRGGSLGKESGTTIPRATGGNSAQAPIPTNAITNTNVQGLAGSATTGNNLLLRNMLSFFAGSLSGASQFTFLQDSKAAEAFVDYKTSAYRVRDIHYTNEASVFVKDDWKVRKSLTLNLGLRWAYFGVPYEGNGLMPLPVGGGNALWGISGRSWEEAFWRPGERADLTLIEFVGKGSPNPDKKYYPDAWANFGPAVGFAWQVPWFGEGKTTVRGGYQMTYQINQSGNNLNQEINAPGSSSTATFSPSSASPYLDLTKLSTMIPVPQPVKPFVALPVTNRSGQIYIPDPGIKTPYAQNLTMQVTRSVRSNLTLDVRYIGTLARKQWNVQVTPNVPNFLYNGLKEAFDAARAGNDSSPALQVLENMFRGINIAGTGFGAVGQTFGGVLQTAGMHLRQNTTFAANLATGNYSALAASLNTFNYVSASNPALPVVPTGVLGAVLRFNKNANGVPLFPENFIVANPQFGTINMMTTLDSNNYHSLETGVTFRPKHGVSFTSTYTWSKNLGVGQNGVFGKTYTRLDDRHADYSPQSDTRYHDFRTNGTFALPIGPNKLLLGNSSGALARIIEGWQIGWILNINSGAPTTIGAAQMLYANATADIVGPFDLKAGSVRHDEGSTWNYLPADRFTQVPDPQCAQVTTLQNLQTSCTLDAIMDNQTGKIVLQTPKPGTRGTLGLRVIEGPGQWRLDANIGKSFKIGESKSVQFRGDAQNILNHPEPSAPSLAITGANFGTINGKSTLHRQFQAQLRFSF